MAPELLTTMEAEELRKLGQQIREWQLARKLSDNALVKKIASLGSTKTFTKILANELGELDLERQLNNYRGAWAFIESITGDDRGDEETYDDLYAVIQLRRVFHETTRELGLGRAIFLLGPSGVGKTQAQRYLIDKYGPRILPIRANVAWNDSPMALLSAILDRLGVRNKPTIQADRLNKVVEALGEVRRCVAIEDSHHLGPRCLNLIVTLIDETPGEFLIAAIDTLWSRLETKNYEECRQLTGNRMAERINLGRLVREPDVRKMIERRVKWAGHDARAVLPLLCDKANNHGRLAFVRETIKRVNDTAGADAVTHELFTAAIQEEVASR